MKTCCENGNLSETHICQKSFGQIEHDLIMRRQNSTQSHPTRTWQEDLENWWIKQHRINRGTIPFQILREKYEELLSRQESEVRAQTIKEIREAVENMVIADKEPYLDIIKDVEQRGQFQHRLEGYNNGIDDVLKLLHT